MASLLTILSDKPCCSYHETRNLSQEQQPANLRLGLATRRKTRQHEQRTNLQPMQELQTAAQVQQLSDWHQVPQWVLPQRLRDLRFHIPLMHWMSPSWGPGVHERLCPNAADEDSWMRATRHPPPPKLNEGALVAGAAARAEEGTPPPPTPLAAGAPPKLSAEEEAARKTVRGMIESMCWAPLPRGPSHAEDDPP